MSLVINHILIRTDDLVEMIRFFEQTLELKNGYRPEFPFSGAWLWSDDRPLIHLSESQPSDVAQSEYLENDKMHSGLGTGSVDHIAFSGADYLGLIERLHQYQLDFLKELCL